MAKKRTVASSVQALTHVAKQRAGARKPVPPPVNAFEPIRVNPCPKSKAPKVDGYACTAAWEVELEEAEFFRFVSVEERLGNTSTLYHGTGYVNIASILENGFRLGSSGMFGAGLYFGPPGKAINYSKRGLGWKQKHQDVGYMFQCSVVLGKQLSCTEARADLTGRKLRAEGYDSVVALAGLTRSWGGTLRGSEYVVYDSAQALVTHIFEYQPVYDYVYGQHKVVPNTCTVHHPVSKTVPKGLKAFEDILGKPSWVPCGKMPKYVISTGVYGAYGGLCQDCARKYAEGDMVVTDKTGARRSLHVLHKC